MPNTARSPSVSTAIAASPVSWRPTLGGLQLWADVELHGPWRIQRHVLRGHYRLLDEWNIARAQGTLDECQAVRLRFVSHSPAPRSQAVLLLHGLGRTRRSMGILGRHLESHGFDVYFVSYPSTQASIGSHARNLQRILHHLDHPGPIHIVGHSMGGLVTRAYLELEVDPRLRRVVTLGTPHQGADMADLLARYRLLPMLGPAAMQLVHGPAGIATKLRPNPARATGLEFGVIAGIGPDGKGFSPLIPHNNDGIVTLASALLEGATDVHLVRGVHSFLMSLISVRIVTERFLRRGYFRAADDRRSVIAIPGPAGAPTVLHIVPAAPPVALDARG